MVDVVYQPFPMAGAARAQVWRYAPQYRRPRHFHAEPELNLVTAGTGTFGSGKAVIGVGPGDLLWWLPGQDHELIEASPDFDLFVVGLAPDLSDRVLGFDREGCRRGPTVVRMAAGDLSSFRAQCEAMNREAPAVSSPAVESHLGDWWRRAHAARASLHDKHVLTRRAIGSLSDRPDLGRAVLAAEFQASPSEMSRTFSRDMGITLAGFRGRVRILKFVHAVDQGESMLSSALAAGFGSYSQCHRVFSGTLGCSPREFFRARMRVAMQEAFSPWRT